MHSGKSHVWGKEKRSEPFLTAQYLTGWCYSKWVLTLFSKRRRMTCTRQLTLENIMTLCPVALAAGCKKCPIFSVCPVKGLIGDYTPDKKPSPKKPKS